jgi:hypothetical protein
VLLTAFKSRLLPVSLPVLLLPHSLLPHSLLPALLLPGAHLQALIDECYAALPLVATRHVGVCCARLGGALEGALAGGRGGGWACRNSMGSDKRVPYPVMEVFFLLLLGASCQGRTSAL